MNWEEIEKLMKKLREYPVGREFIYVPGSKTDPETFRHEINDLNMKVSILIREFDKIIRIIHFLADTYNDATMKELSDKLKGL